VRVWTLRLTVAKWQKITDSDSMADRIETESGVKTVGLQWKPLSYIVQDCYWVHSIYWWCCSVCNVL